VITLHRCTRMAHLTVPRPRSNPGGCLSTTSSACLAENQLPSEENRCQQCRAERAVTILEPGEDETCPPISSGRLLNKTMITSVGPNEVEIQYGPSGGSGAIP
jgi:hypothetical protein